MKSNEPSVGLSSGMVMWASTIVVTSLVVACAVGCGTGVRSDAKRAHNTVASGMANIESGAGRPSRYSDSDADSKGGGYYDKDDSLLTDYGSTGGPSDRRDVAALLGRYYAAAASGDGAAGCTLLYPLFAEVVMEEVAGSMGSPSPTGPRCAKVMSELFKRDHARLAASLSTLHVVGLRVKGVRAYALLGVGPRPERIILIHREGHAWKLQATVDTGLP